MKHCATHQLCKFLRAPVKTIILTVSALMIFFLLLELAARTLLPTSDIPDVVFDPYLGNHFRANQKGIYVSGLSSEIRARYRINNKGWNSPHDYQNIPSVNEFRIAVIGDSFVEAIQVDYGKSFPFILENSLQEVNPGHLVSVYSFGHSGANLAQYTQVAKHVMDSYKPDLIIVTVVHNDFLEMLEKYARIDNWALRPVGNSFSFRAPRKSENFTRKRILRHSAFIRYLVVNLRILERFSGLKQRLEKTRKFEANIDSAVLDVHIRSNEIEYALGFLLDRLRKTMDGTKLLFVIDGSRQAIYAGTNPRETLPYSLNQLFRKQTEKYGFSLIDLNDWFEEDWKREGKWFNWAIDYHWNTRGHMIVSLAIEEFLTQNQIILGSGER